MKKGNYSLKAISMMIMLLCASMAASAQDTFCYQGIYYMITDYNTVAVTSSPDNSYSGTIDIPSSVSTKVYFYGQEYDEYYQVTSIGEGAFRDCSGLHQVNLPNSIYSIGRNAFYNCTGLTSITLPSSLEVIGQSAFGYCTLLTSIEIPNSVETMDWNAFYCCTGLTHVSISNSLSSLYGTFYGCTGLTSVDIPESVKRLDGTFTGCTGLTTMDIPASVEYIGKKTFMGCTNLTTVVLPAKLTYIEEEAFFNCDNLKSITSKAVEPPTIYAYNSDCFDYTTYTNANLYVPNTAVADYEIREWWCQFKHILGLISLNQSSITLEPNQTFQLTAQLAPGFGQAEEIVWFSEDESVVTVNEAGLIKAIANGTAFIYAAIDNERAMCEVIVKGNSLPGDVNNDGEINIADINVLIDTILSENYDASTVARYDINQDGEVTIADVNALINKILGI